MSPELFSSILATILSLLASYLPGFAPWYAARSSEAKRLLMLGVLAVIAAAAYGIACSGYGPIFGLQLTCDSRGLITLVQSFLAALSVNQATYLISSNGRSQG